MSADRYEIDAHDDGAFIVTNLNGYRFIVDANCVDIRSRAIRQQARDLDQLRADLAAAVAERDSIRRNALDLTECAMKTIPADWHPGYAWTDDGVMNVLAEYVDELRQRAEQAEARLAAIAKAIDQ